MASIVENGTAPDRHIALMIDADNVSHTKIAAILTEITRYGTANIRRAYGDWSTTALKGWKDKLHEYAVRPIQQFAYSSGKNATDIALVIDTLELLYTQRLGQSRLGRSQRVAAADPCRAARHSLPAGRARSAPRRNTGFRVREVEADTADVGSMAWLSVSTMPAFSPRPAGRTGSASGCGRGRRDSRAPGGCRDIVRGSAPRWSAARPGHSPTAWCGHAGAAASAKASAKRSASAFSRMSLNNRHARP
jgi:hypothetical protein